MIIGVEHIRMKNILEDYVSPCIMDIKIGFQIWDPTTSARKIAKRKVSLAKFPMWFLHPLPRIYLYMLTSHLPERPRKGFPSTSAETVPENIY